MLRAQFDLANVSACPINLLGDQGRALQTVARSALRDVFAAVDANRSSARDRNRALPASAALTRSGIINATLIRSRNGQLLDQARTTFEELGAELGPSWLKLHKTLSRREMLEVWVILCKLRERTDDDQDENHILFALGDWLSVASERFGIAMPLEDFVRNDPHKDLMRKVTSAADIGPVTVMGVPCEHLAFTQDNIDWQLWIENGATPVPRKFVITYKDEADSPQYTAIFSNWDFTTKLPDFVFQFEPPAGASKIKVKEMKTENQSHKMEEK